MWLGVTLASHAFTMPNIVIVGTTFMRYPCTTAALRLAEDDQTLFLDLRFAMSA